MGYLEFIRKEQAKLRSLTTGSVLLDRAFQIPLNSSLLLLGEASSGTTAVGLELAKSFLTNTSGSVIYFDIYQSIYTHRIMDLIQFESRFMRTCPQTILEATTLIQSVSKLNKPFMVVIDGLALLDELKEKVHKLRGLSEYLVRVPNCTAINLHKRGAAGSFWGSYVNLSFEERRYIDGELVGHTVKVKGPLGTASHYIEYKTGRLSRAYEYAQLQIENGASPSSEFNLDGVKVKGLWKFVDGFTEQTSS